VVVVLVLSERETEAVGAAAVIGACPPPSAFTGAESVAKEFGDWSTL
jgi:hypothetical protein